jgi:hypothetical protein
VDQVREVPVSGEDLEESAVAGLRREPARGGGLRVQVDDEDALAGLA